MAVTTDVAARLFAKGFVRYLSSHGYEVTLVANQVSEIERELSESGVKVFSLPMRRDPSIFLDLVSLFRFLFLLLKVKPTAVIYATPKASLLAALSSWACRVPVRTYYLWGIRFETSSGLSRKLYASIERLTAKLSTSISANSLSLANRASELRIASRSRIEVVGHGSSHGVDSKYFSKHSIYPEVDAPTANFLSTTKGFTIGYVGRIHPDKGIDTLFKSLAQLECANVDFRVLLVGPDEGAVQMDSFLPSSVHCYRTGAVRDVRPYLACIDALVLMSLREGFPNIVLEAACMEVPAVVSDATGCIDSVVNEKTGFVVPVSDVEALTAALKTLINDHKLSQRLGHNARIRAEEYFAQEDVWSGYEQLLASELGKLQ